MSTRGGDRYERTFMEAWVLPGIGLRNWVSRSNYPAYGIVPTGPAEMSLYISRHNAQQSAHVARYTLRTDGFASVRAGYQGGEMLTRPLVFAGGALEINFATSAAGSIRVEIQDAAGKPMPGFALGRLPGNHRRRDRTRGRLEAGKRPEQVGRPADSLATGHEGGRLVCAALSVGCVKRTNRSGERCALCTPRKQLGRRDCPEPHTSLPTPIA